jgi:hypothetical protein
VNELQGNSRHRKKLLGLATGMIFPLTKNSGYSAADNKHGTGAAGGHSAIQGCTIKGHAPFRGLTDGILFSMDGADAVLLFLTIGVDYGVVKMTDFITVILTATLASIGTAAVPGVGLITLALVLEQAGLPVEGIGLIIGVDRLLDMVRTAVNVTGDATVSAIVGKSEKQFDEQVWLNPNADLGPDTDDSIEQKMPTAAENTD